LAWSLANHDASLGEAWAGPQGFLSILETQLGLAGPLNPKVEGLRPWFHRFRQLPVSGASRRTLIRWVLPASCCVGGYPVVRRLAGEGVAQRLTQLATVTKDVLPGIPDRLASGRQSGQTRRTDITAVHLLEPRSSLSKLWQNVLESVESAGARFTNRNWRLSTASGDLLHCRSKGFTPKSDGSLQLLRSQGPQLAAEEVAAWLASLPDRQGTVIVAPDALLDAALHRYGLPTMGATNPLADNALLEILPLVLSLGWLPPDPERALELMTLPVSPGTAFDCRRLVEALQQWPAVDSDLWRAGFGRGPGEDRRSR